MSKFKTPHDIPQDLLFIQELIGKIEDQQTVTKLESPVSTDVDSSDTEDEVEALLIQPDSDFLETTQHEIIVKQEEASSELPESSDSETDAERSEDSDAQSVDLNQLLDGDLDEEEESLPIQAIGAHVLTKNETAVSDITIPSIDEVGAEEAIELAGRITNVIGNIVIVTSGDAMGRKTNTLDAGTLLVFEDRKVLGHLYETFGPTAQPLYQVRFNDSYPLNPDKVQTSKTVYHVPARSNFVFLNQLRNIKGSDASNMHDEEPAADELEFSDDELEAAFKAKSKRKRGDSRLSSTGATSRASTPSQMRDQELHGLAGNAYDAHGPYDIDYTGAGLSLRPMPIPYDDPYSEEYNTGARNASGSQSLARGDVREAIISYESEQSSNARDHRIRPRGHEKNGRSRARGNRGRGRGRGRGQLIENWQNQEQPENLSRSEHYQAVSHPDARYTAHHATPQSTAMAVERAAVQYDDDRSYGNHPSHPSSSMYQQTWNYPQTQIPFSFNQQAFSYAAQPIVQPHINPRFASALGFLPWGQASYGLDPYSSTTNKNDSALAFSSDSVSQDRGIPPSNEEREAGRQ